MTEVLLEAILQVILLMPFAFLLLKSKATRHIQRLLLVVFIFVVYQVALALPTIQADFTFIASSWNWEGKLYGISWGIISYFLFRNYFKTTDFFTLKQSKAYLKPALLAAIGIVLLSITAGFVFDKEACNIEALAFQFTLPGLDEEMMFRGILLGLLASSLKEKIPYLGNPSIVLTAILFGFTHALTLNKADGVNFDTLYFVQTCFQGYVWGWITLKSRSILLPILSHNCSNFFGMLATMIG